MISIITAGRDDDYGVGFLKRLKKSILTNVNWLEKNNIEYEYIVVEWNPLKKPLSEHPDFIDVFSNQNIKDIVVSKSVSKAEHLSETIFYEYFAKNVGVRESKYDNILIINSDIIITDACFEVINNLIKSGLDDNRFYRARYRQQVDFDMNIILTQDCHYPQNNDAIICGFCSGDFLLVKKDIFINNGQGYDETNNNHRITTLSQTGMDAEILWNMHNSGIKLQFIDEIYQHINHGKPNAYDGCYNMNGYTNKKDWGFIKYNRIINNNVLIIQ